MKKCFLYSALFALSVGTALASEKDEALKMVSDAAAAAAKDKAGTIAEMNKPTGHYVKGEMYVFAYDLNGVMVAHPINAKLVGKSLIEVPDADGKLFRKEIIGEVNARGSANVDYKYKNPQTGKVEEKVSFCKKAAELAICAGYYK